MTIQLRNLEWLDHNGSRSYPVSVESTRLDQTGAFRLPNDFLVGLYLKVHSGLNMAPGRFFLRRLGNHTAGFGLTLAYSPVSGDPVDVAAANIARAAYQPYRGYRLTGLGDFYDTTGFVQLGRLDGINEQPAGQFLFEFEATRLETDAVRPALRGISSLRVQSGNDLSDPLYGDVILEAGSNVRLTVVQVAGEDPTIVVDAIEGEGLNEECICTEDNAEAPPIRRINGVTGTPDGDFSLLGSTCLTVEAIQHGLRLKDVCSEPCCTCRELEIVTQQLEQFGQQARTLENFLVNLEARVTQTDQLLLGARLGDRSCSECESDEEV